MKNVLKNKVTYYIENIENKSKHFTVEDMVNICKRKNNTKRDYLFVNTFQGKHIPQAPKNIVVLFEELLEEIKKGIDVNERVLVVGFAETATAIGNYIANNLPNCVFKLQTTREYIKDAKKLINFEEEHSHAVGQWLYAGSDIPTYDRVLFVEDEITTGKTIINFIKEFSKLAENKKYSVASILNWQNLQDASTYLSLGIDTFCIVRGNLKADVPLLEVETVEPIAYTPISSKPKIKEFYVLNPFAFNERLGDRPYPTKQVLNRMASLVELMKKQDILIEEGMNIAVLGTEEFMYLPLMLSFYLEQMGVTSLFHATTRSPICISEQEGYAIRNGITLSSAYEDTRITYLYNLKEYDKVLVVTDAETMPRFKEEITALCLSKGAKEVIILQLI